MTTPGQLSFFEKTVAVRASTTMSCDVGSSDLPPSAGVDRVDFLDGPKGVKVRVGDPFAVGRVGRIRALRDFDLTLPRRVLPCRSLGCSHRLSCRFCPERSPPLPSTPLTPPPHKPSTPTPRSALVGKVSVFLSCFSPSLAGRRKKAPYPCHVTPA
jgi:hypothetical protein